MNEEASVSDLRTELLAELSLYQQLPNAEDRVRIRKAAGISQRRMAMALGVTEQTIANWEQGKRPGVHHAKAYLELLEELERVMAE